MLKKQLKKKLQEKDREKELFKETRMLGLPGKKKFH
jgi:hypothetical protein